MSYQEVTNLSYFGRIKNAIVGVFFGLIFFIGGIVLLFWNEGRAVKTYLSLKEGASSVISVSFDQMDSRYNGKLVHISGKATTDESIADTKFGITVNAIALKRKVEMYQWDETKNSKTQTKTGGGSTTTTTYNYNKKWSSSLIRSSNFKQANEHKNPAEMPLKSDEFFANSVNVGEFFLSSNLIRKISNFTTYDFKDLALAPKVNGVDAIVDGGTLYYGKDSSAPQIGDIRVEFQIAEQQIVSLIAQQNEKSLSPFMTSVGKPIELLVMGQHGAQEMFQAEQDSNTMWTWIIRAGGFLMMLIGMNLILAPLSVLASIVPLIGDIVAAGTGFISFCISLPSALVVISVAWITYRPALAISLIVSASLLGYLIYAKRKTRPVAVVKTKAKPAIKSNISLVKLTSPENQNPKYFVYSKDKKYGLFTIEKIEDYLARGKVNFATLCREVDSKSKIRISEIPGIKKAV